LSGRGAKAHNLVIRSWKARKLKDASLDLEHLRFFRVLLETGALNRTAERLDMSHAASSRALDRLRLIFDDKLFVKSASGMLPTPRATALLPRVVTALTEMEHLLTPDAFDPALTTRAFHIGAVDNSFLTICGDVIAEFVRRACNASLEFYALDADFFEQLKDGRLDAAVYARDPLPPDFHKLELVTNDFVCLVRNNHPLTRITPSGEAPRLSEFQRYRRMRVKIQRGSEAKCIETDAGMCELPGGIAVSTPYFVSACAVLEKTDLVLILPRRTANQFARMMALTILPTPLPSKRVNVGLIWHHRVHGDPAMKWLRQLFAEVFRAGSATATPAGAMPPPPELPASPPKVSAAERVALEPA
jgi:DNA-binding transcriptional LysR family regulator